MKIDNLLSFSPFSKINIDFPEKSEHFHVEEVLGDLKDGKFIHLLIKKKDRSSEEVAQEIRSLFKGFNNLDNDFAVSYAGKKDLCSTSIQFFCLGPFQNSDARTHTDLIQAFSKLKVECLKVLFFKEKIRRGHLKGNFFKVILPNVSEKQFKEIQTRIDKCKEGVPNFFGPQRFRNPRKVMVILDILRKQNRIRRKRKNLAFEISIFQSLLFNFWLIHRLSGIGINAALTGDKIKKRFTGGIFKFEKEDPNILERLKSREATVLGPIFGYKILKAEENSLNFEKNILKQLSIDFESFRIFGTKAKGSRRPMLFYPEKLSFEKTKLGPQLSFFLPSGTYATVLFDYLMGKLDLQSLMFEIPEKNQNKAQ